VSEEIVLVSSLVPFGWECEASSVDNVLSTHNLIVFHGITPSFSGNIIDSIGGVPVEVKAVLVVGSSNSWFISIECEEDFVNDFVSVVGKGLWKVGGSSGPEMAEVSFSPWLASTGGSFSSNRFYSSNSSFFSNSSNGFNGSGGESPIFSSSSAGRFLDIDRWSTRFAPVDGGSLEISHCVSCTSWVETTLSSGPVWELEFLEFGPDLFLCSLEVNVGSCWAVVHWLSSGKSPTEVFVVPASLEDKDDDHDVKDGKTNKDETEYLSTSESTDESLMDGGSASVGNSGVGIDSDSHTNVTGKDGGHWSGKVGGGGVWEVGWGSCHAHLEEIDGSSEDDSEGAGPDGKPDVFFVKESFGAFSNFGTNEFKGL
jgi:hypothetical protein